MILNDRGKTVVTSGDFTEKSFGVDVAGLPHLFEIVRKIYPNPILALVREYACNGYDSQVLKGNEDKPLEIFLPTQTDAHLRVRDFGVGMSEDDIFNTYCFYGKSGKEKSASNNFIGGFGIGAKSFGCYGDSMIVESFQNGIKSVYTCYIDETKIGKVAKIATYEEPDQPDGVRIVIGIRSGDFSAVARAAAQVFKYWKVKPIIKGNKSEYECYVTTDRVSMEGDKWQLIDRSDTSYAIMGQIAYRIERDAFNLDSLSDYDKSVVNLAAKGAIVHFDIGELDISPSRETLEMSQRTISNLLVRFREIKDHLLSEFNNGIDKCQNIYEIKKYCRDEIYYGSFNRFRQILMPIKWNGMEITDWNFHLPSDVLLQEWGEDDKKPRLWSSYSGHTMIEPNTRVYVNDCDNIRVPLSRMRTVFGNGDTSRVFVLTGTSPQTRANIRNIAAELGLQPSDFTYLSEVEKTIVRGQGVTRSGAFLMLRDWTKYSIQNRDHWRPVDVDFENGSGIYVAINRFSPVNSDLDILKETITDLKKLKINIPLYGIREKNVKLLGDKWMHLDDFLKLKVPQIVAKFNYKDRKASDAVASKMQEFLSEYHVPDTLLLEAESQLPDGSVAKEAVNVINKYNQRYTNKHIDYLLRVSRLNSTVMATSIDYSELDILLKFKQKYPMLAYVDLVDWRMTRSENLTNLVNYIKLAEQ